MRSREEKIGIAQRVCNFFIGTNCSKEQVTQLYSRVVRATSQDDSAAFPHATRGMKPSSSHVRDCLGTAALGVTKRHSEGAHASLTVCAPRCANVSRSTGEHSVDLRDGMASLPMVRHVAGSRAPHPQAAADRLRSCANRADRRDGGHNKGFVFMHTLKDD